MMKASVPRLPAYVDVDAWVDPVIDPFVGGLWEPFGPVLARLQWHVAAVAAGIAGVGVVTGYLLGSWYPLWGRGGERARGGGGRGRGG